MLERNLLRDKTLVLRIQDERLQQHLREKMANQEKAAAATKSSDANVNAPSSYLGGGGSSSQNSSGSSSNLSTNEGKIFDLEGVTCEPAIQTTTPFSSSFLDYHMHKSPQERAAAEAELLDQHTLWNFHCDGATYPARLINLPCPIEVHKTHDHAMYYKCVDIAQMLIVYEDMTALEEAESMPGYKNEGYPSYFHSGLTPPMTKVVQRRFMQREHADVPPPMQEVMDVEKDLLQLIEAISTKDPTKRTGRGNHSANRSLQTKVLEEIEDEVVEYEPWMDNYGREPKGIEFDETDAVCKKHPEVWLDPEELEELKVPSIVDEPSSVSDHGGVSGPGGGSSLVEGTGTGTGTGMHYGSGGGKPKGKGSKESKKKKSKEQSSASSAGDKSKPKPEKKPKKKKSKKKDAPAAAPVLPSSPPPISSSRPPSTNPETFDAINIDQFDFDLDVLGEDFDMDGIVD